MTRRTRLGGLTASIAAAVWLAAPAPAVAAMPDPPEPVRTPVTVRTVPVEVEVEVPVEVPVDVGTAAEAVRIGVAALLGAALTATVVGPWRPRRRRPGAGAGDFGSRSDGREPEVLAHNWP
jgi:anaerobic selenocysteine-containing dehydrogenase